MSDVFFFHQLEPYDAGINDQALAMSKKQKQLRAINAMRVIAEYFVVRHHILPSLRLLEGRSLGNDIMCFFFVLSGFVFMYAYEQKDFSGWKAKKEFILSKITKIYPIYLLVFAFCIPMKIIRPSPIEEKCWIYTICRMLQVFFMDSWFGCGHAFILPPSIWFVSCVIWIWILFPFIKDCIVNTLYGNSQHIWTKILAINIIWGSIFYCMWDYKAYTISSLPAFRLGEFLIGCGSALGLKENAEPFWRAGKRFWFPAIAVIIFYNIEFMGIKLLQFCRSDESISQDCTIWQPIPQPLDTVFLASCTRLSEKIFNRYAFVWALAIHGVAKEELRMMGNHDHEEHSGGINSSSSSSSSSNDKHWTMAILTSDIFHFLGRYSLTLYAGHTSMNDALNWISRIAFNTEENVWKDDTRIFLVYTACYFLHCFMQWATHRFSGYVFHKKQESQHHELGDEELLIEATEELAPSAAET